MLRHLLRARVGKISDDAQVRFEPPDDDWKTYVANLTVGGSAALAVNVFLVELRENRELRSNERTRELDNGLVTETKAPRRVNCHYWITAWSPASSSGLKFALG
ncbi:MAG: DUF4255 domain-containing protein [Myxococcales bacterium]|nr:DUF4255 domain-containing protein [Myxococcales bacterium]